MHSCSDAVCNQVLLLSMYPFLIGPLALAGRGLNAERKTLRSGDRDGASVSRVQRWAIGGTEGLWLCQDDAAERFSGGVCAWLLTGIRGPGQAKGNMR